MKNDIYKLLTGKVRIIGDSLMGIEEVQRFSNHVKHSIDRVFQYSKNKPDWEDYGSDNIWSMVNDWSDGDKMLKKAALHIFGTNFPDAIDKLKTLQIYVEGRCPECGEPIEEGYEEHLPATHDRPGEGPSFNQCTLCTWNDLHDESPRSNKQTLYFGPRGMPLYL